MRLDLKCLISSAIDWIPEFGPITITDLIRLRQAHLERKLLLRVRKAFFNCQIFWKKTTSTRPRCSYTSQGHYKDDFKSTKCAIKTKISSGSTFTAFRSAVPWCDAIRHDTIMVMLMPPWDYRVHLFWMRWHYAIWLLCQRCEKMRR